MSEAEEKKEVGDAINLKVVTQDGNEIFFKVRRARAISLRAAAA